MIVKNLLFVEPLGDGNTPLFKTQLDLAGALIAVKNGGFEGKTAENVRIFVNQVLKAPNEPRARPFSRNMQRALPQAIQSRQSDPSKAAEAVERVLKAVEKLKNQLERPADDDLEWGALMQANDNTALKEVVVITSNPAETQEDDIESASNLTSALIQRAILKEASDFDPFTRYDFFILNEEKAHAMRSNIIRHISVAYSKAIEEAEALVQEAQTACRLNIYFFDYQGFFPSMCVFEPNSSNIQGYYLNYPQSGGDRVASVAVLDENELRNWKSGFHRRMYSTREYDKAEQVKPVKGTVKFSDRQDIAYLLAA